MKLSAALVFASVLLFAPTTYASSGYGNSIASPSFRYTYVENVRKMFVNDDQQTSYMASHDRDMKLRFLAFQATAEKAIADARKKGVAVGPYDLFLPAVRLSKPADVAKIDAKAYPLNLVLDVSDANAQASFEVTATKPWTATQITSLTAALDKISKPAPAPSDSDREKALLDAAAFAVPVAVTHIDDRFGLYVGTVTEIPAQDRTRVVEALQAALDKLVPSVRTNLALPDTTKRLGAKALNKVKPLVAKKKLPGAFNPWGPLVEGALIRTKVSLGNVDVILMIAPKGKYDWGTISPAMTKILGDAGTADPHRDLIESEATRLRGEGN